MGEGYDGEAMLRGRRLMTLCIRFEGSEGRARGVAKAKAQWAIRLMATFAYDKKTGARAIEGRGARSGQQ